MPKSSRKRAQKSSQPLQQPSAPLSKETEVSDAVTPHEFAIFARQHDEAARGKKEHTRSQNEEARIAAKNPGHLYENMNIGGASRIILESLMEA